MGDHVSAHSSQIAPSLAHTHPQLPAPVPQSSAQQTDVNGPKWVCSKCTFKNSWPQSKTDVARCAICDNNHPAIDDVLTARREGKRWTCPLADVTNFVLIGCACSNNYV